jgi:hypothetical protein
MKDEYKAQSSPAGIPCRMANPMILLPDALSPMSHGASFVHGICQAALPAATGCGADLQQGKR